MLQHVGVVVSGQHRVDGDRHHAGVQRAQKGHRPVVAVEHQQQHALFAAQADGAQAGGQAAGALGQGAVAQAALVVDEGRLVGAAGVGVEQVLREVETGRRRQGFGWVHGVSKMRLGLQRD